MKDDERKYLEGITGSRTEELTMYGMARIIFMDSEGKNFFEIASDLGIQQKVRPNREQMHRMNTNSRNIKWNHFQDTDKEQYQV